MRSIPRLGRVAREERGCGYLVYILHGTWGLIEVEPRGWCGLTAWVSKNRNVEKSKDISCSTGGMVPAMFVCAITVHEGRSIVTATAAAIFSNIDVRDA